MFTKYKDGIDFNQLCETTQNKYRETINDTSMSSSTFNCLIKDKKSETTKIINVGDSRAYIISLTGSLYYTDIHNATNKNEVDRITTDSNVQYNIDEKGYKYFSHQRNKFELSRAFGYQGSVFNECKPEPDVYNLLPSHAFAIIMSDGLERAGLERLRKNYEKLPEITRQNVSDEKLHASFICQLITLLIDGKTEDLIKEKVIREFNEFDKDDKSMVFIPIHLLKSSI